MSQVISPNVRQVIRWFDLDLRNRPAVTPPAFDPPMIADGQILLITGPSGSGKSFLMRNFHRKYSKSIHAPRWIDLDRIHLPDRPLVDCFGDLPLVDVLRLLGRCGLGEAWCYLQPPQHLSNGQRWRFRLAMGLASAKPDQRSIIVCDEFATLLDDITAGVIARSLRRIIRNTPGLSAICATSRDIAPALQPDRILTCDFGQITVHSVSA